jgi:HEPN domain-containing protein
MTRRDLQQLATLRIREARQLLQTNNFSGAYYLAGYTIELGLKACIARKTRRYDFPELTVVRDSFTHDLKKLVKIAGLEKYLNQQINIDAAFATNWAIVKDWDVESRYRNFTQTQAEEIIYSITSRRNGILGWIRQHW